MSRYLRETRDPEIAFGCPGGGSYTTHADAERQVDLKRMPEKAQTKRKQTKTSISPLRLFEVFVVLGGVLLFVYALVAGFVSKDEAPAEPDTVVAAEPQDKDYSRFTH